MARGCFFVVEAFRSPLKEMVDIGRTDKLTNLWPTPASRAIEKSVSKKKFSHNKQDHKKQEDDTKDDETGNNIDEYA